MAAGRGYPVAGEGQGSLRAADADRDRVAGILGTAYSEGRLSRDEYDARLDSAMSARTYLDLDHVLTDLPAVQEAAAPSPAVPAMVTRPAARSGALVNRAPAWRWRA